MTKRKKKKTSKKIFILILLLSILLIILLIAQLDLITYLKNIKKEPELFVIKDECALILNNLIHQIKTEGECKIKCEHNCDIREKNFHDSEFIEKNDDCNICNCYCK